MKNNKPVTVCFDDDQYEKLTSYAIDIAPLGGKPGLPALIRHCVAKYLKDYNPPAKLECAHCGQWHHPKWCIVKGRPTNVDG